MPDRIVATREFALARGGSKGCQAGPVFTITGYNHSGGSVARGDVVIFDKTNSTNDVIHFTTTTSASDMLVLGMVYDTSIANTKMGKIQIWGPTDALKVDGTTDIAKGDLIGTFTSAKIGAKTSGTGAFAIAMEAYATNDSAGVIDAFIRAMDIVSPDGGEFSGVSAGTATASKGVVLGANKNLDTLVIADSGLYLGSGAGTAVTATAAELNKNAGVTAGTASASKTAVLGANKNLDTLVIADGGLCLGAAAGTAVSATAAEINANCDGTITQVTQSVGAEAGHVISVTCTFKDAGGAAVAGDLVYYTSSDSAGATPVAVQGSITASTGAVMEITSKKMGIGVSNASGQLVLALADNTTVNHYLNFILPTGKRTTSAILAFD